MQLIFATMLYFHIRWFILLTNLLTLILHSRLKQYKDFYQSYKNYESKLYHCYLLIHLTLIYYIKKH
uniref:Uncharacterized protein n=1 Tax=Ciona intestinalis TaxID=7719 RepID=H2XXT3_CIOIN